LIGQGYRVLNVDCLTYAGDLGRLADVADHPNYEFQKISITNAAAFDGALNQFAPDAVLHLAAETHVDRSIDGPRQFVETNVGGTLNVLQSLLRYWEDLDEDRKQRFRLLHVSTDEVYGHLGPQGLFTEQSPYAPRSPYSASKAAADHLVRAWGTTYGLPILVVNCSNNYGPCQHPEKLIPLAISRALRGQPIPIYGRGENVRDWLYVEDHCEALQAVLERGQTGESYNVGGSCEVRNIDLVTELCERLDKLRPLPPATGKQSYKQFITYVEDRPGHDFRYAIDATKLRTNLGWAPRHTLQTGLEKTIRWYIERGERRETEAKQ
jgi:dTDP-glucose 4,6-dehydratase